MYHHTDLSVYYLQYLSFLKKLILPKIDPLLDAIPQHQFGFRHSHSTIQQCHRVVHEINKTFEDKKYCFSVFLDISQAFDKVWHDGHLYKIKLYLPSHFKLFKSYLCERQFRIRVNGEISNTFPIRSGVPQGSVLGPVLYLVYTSDLPTTENTLTGTFAGETVMLASHEDPQDCINPPTAPHKPIRSLGNKMENQDKRKQINAGYVYIKKEPMSTNFLQQHINTRITTRQIFRNAYG
jgi:hypothetical protein